MKKYIKNNIFIYYIIMTDFINDNVNVIIQIIMDVING